MITLTERAVLEIRRILDEQHQDQPDMGLRVGVKGGGCSGLSYTLRFDQKTEKDKVLDTNGVPVYCDPKSYLYLEGMTLDFEDTLMGRGFKFHNPNAKRTCGCGDSFSA
ncbi:MAG: iron-sulfur cluster assembly accessory protein [Planctomycetes bacterium]|nr:iron-sulfur cluster assembly accessory protein [Planctomycetota bacterium]